MRLIHTADWHLGHTLREQSRAEEHAAFLGWLLDQLEAEGADALLVAGDVFHSANPPTHALRAWYGFLAEARQRMPALDIVVIGGNHDSAPRLDAPGALLDELGVQVVGAPPRDARGLLHEDLLHPITREGEVCAWVLAVPFLRPADLPRGLDAEEGVRAVYATALARAREQATPEQAIVAMGHCHLESGALSERSERRIYGRDSGLPEDVLPEVAYVALGHLHLPQALAPHVHYCGSPIPLSLAEAGYAHQVLCVDFEGPALVAVRPVQVPRATRMLRLPEEGPLPLEQVLEILDALAELDPDTPPWRRPFLEVSVAVDGPEPTLRSAVEKALEGKAARLVRLNVARTEAGEALADGLEGADLLDLDPAEVFQRRWSREHPGAPPIELRRAFDALLAAVEAGE